MKINIQLEYSENKTNTLDLSNSETKSENRTQILTFFLDLVRLLGIPSEVGVYCLFVTSCQIDSALKLLFNQAEPKDIWTTADDIYLHAHPDKLDQLIESKGEKNVRNRIHFLSEFKKNEKEK
ncbi:telomere repeat-binding factor 2-interacting protein [Anaeramoeba ignava]|uniref:Telomere repeat-binding factor 2-interacting protein n=1 Tax=Anaeramoeba ignava TaxID=1746090 RepID=A0A9Q0R4V3_ANAIG|nr:telomere repeat-binding factor 2-interacting protein [Anaeramoeba ignava]